MVMDIGMAIEKEIGGGGQKGVKCVAETAGLAVVAGGGNQVVVGGTGVIGKRGDGGRREKSLVVIAPQGEQKEGRDDRLSSDKKRGTYKRVNRSGKESKVA